MAHQQMHDVIASAVAACGHTLYACFQTQESKGTLYVLIDDSSGLTLGDCVTITEQIEEAFIQNDINRDHINIEVASPGLDRPLFTVQHYKAVIGHKIKIKLDQPIEETRQKHITGQLINATDEGIELIIEKDFSQSFPYDNILKAQTVDLSTSRRNT